MSFSLTATARSVVISRLREAGCVFAEDEAAIILAGASSVAEVDAMVERRVAGLPLEHVVGWAEFCGLRIAVSEGVFVPRMRTEFLVGQAIRLAPDRRAVVVDLCCGSGAVGRALAEALDDAELYASDIDPAAIACARRNLAAHGQVFVGDLYEPLPAALRGRVDLLVVNAPYVPTDEIELLPREARLYEPSIALDGGVDGLDIHRRVAHAAHHWLASGGHLLIETSGQQAALTAEIFTANGLAAHVITSAELHATVVVGSAPRSS